MGLATVGQWITCSDARDAGQDRAEPSAPRVSIVIPCYKGAAFLPVAIESCLTQTLENFELIVVDDASPDQCAEIAERYAKTDARVRVIRHKVNGGVSAAFNTGFSSAKGRYFTRLAQDDYFAPEALASMVSFLEANKGLGLAYADYVMVDEQGTVTARVTVPEPQAVLTVSNRLGLCMMWLREVWDAVGAFRPEYDTAEDYDYWLRVWDRYPIGKCPGAPLFIREHEARGTIRFADRQERATLRLLREAYPRRFSAFRRFFLRRKAISWVLTSAASDYGAHGKRWIAVQRVLRSFVAWPLPYAPGEAKHTFGRTRLLARLLTGRYGRR